MDAQNQAIVKFVEAMKLDRHDWEDWPKDSREAYAALLAQLQPAAAPTLDDMVSRFLCWRLPDNFAPDCHIKFDKDAATDFPTTWPTGTNLLDAAQARAMLAHVIGG